MAWILYQVITLVLVLLMISELPQQGMSRNRTDPGEPSNKVQQQTIGTTGYMVAIGMDRAHLVGYSWILLILNRGYMFAIGMDMYGYFCSRSLLASLVSSCIAINTWLREEEPCHAWSS